MRPAQPRDRLLAAALDYVVGHGVGDLSLRELAAAIGSSHRMLIYHFGSKAGLLVAIVQASEEAERRFFAAGAPGGEASPVEAARAFWRRVSDPALWPRERLFFELYGQALQGRPGTTGFLEGIVDSWLDPVTEYGTEHGMSREEARAEARLGAAVVRGLLLDLLASGDRRGADEAFERYLGAYDARRSAASGQVSGAPGQPAG
ncbi:MAG TPA: TetR/AcrR family transcriptional regulator [Acidimicrobiales bacterium]|nr:TetR/AcrR family transcriptional regulator [Acidimicrobiales bacterium]